MKADFNADEVTSGDLILGLAALRGCRATALTFLQPVTSGHMPATSLPPEGGSPRTESGSSEESERWRRLRTDVPATNDEAAEAMLDALIAALQQVRSTRRIREILASVPPPRNRNVAAFGSESEQVFPGSNEMPVSTQVGLLVRLTRSLCASLEAFEIVRPNTAEGQHLRACGQHLDLLERLLRPFQSGDTVPPSD